MIPVNIGLKYKPSKCPCHRHTGSDICCRSGPPGSMGPSGKEGLKGEPGSPGISGNTNTSYAQYGVNSNPPSNSFLPCFEIFEAGELTCLQSADTIILETGYVYLINYIFLAVTGGNNYFQIVPFVNEEAQLLYSSFAPANISGNATASGSFIINQALNETADLRLKLAYPSSVGNIDISGAVSIIPVAVKSK